MKQDPYVLVRSLPSGKEVRWDSENVEILRRLPAADRRA